MDDSRSAPLVIAHLIVRHRIDLTDEKRTQADIETVFVSEGIEFSREHRLSSSDIVDFMVGSTAVEVKIGGSRASIYRQLVRYAQHESVHSIILVTSVPMALPPTIDGKPALVASLGAAWI